MIKKSIILGSALAITINCFSTTIANGDVYKGNKTYYKQNEQIHSVVVTSNKVIKINNNYDRIKEISKITEKPIEKVKYINNIIRNKCSKYSMPQKFIQAICIIESDYNPNCVGPQTKYGKARGIIQLMPELLKEYNVNNPFNPEESINAGIQYLNFLINRYSKKEYYDQNGKLITKYEMAAMAYNWGLGNLERHMKRHDCVVIANTKNGIPKETFNYIKKLRKYYN